MENNKIIYKHIGAIPHTWKTKKLKYLILNQDSLFIDGDWINSDVLEEEGIPYYTTGNIGDGLFKISENQDYISEKTFQNLFCTKIIGGDLLFSRLNAPYGRACIMPIENNESVVAVDVTVLRPDNNINRKYLMYFTMTVPYQEHTDTLARGTTMRRLSKMQLGNIVFPIPSLLEQNKIVLFLDNKCSEIDSVIRDINKQIVILDKYKKSIIAEAVTKGINKNVELKDSGIQWIGKMPSSWQLLKAKSIFIQRSTKGNKLNLELLTPSQKYGVLPQLEYDRISGMNSVKMNNNTNLNLLKTIHRGDFCISLRSFQGGFEYSQYEGVVSPAYQVFYGIGDIHNGYYKYLFKEKGFIEKMNSYTMTLRDGKNIAFSDFGNSQIPVPPKNEQIEISNYLDRKCEIIDNLVIQKQKQLQTLEYYKKSLIYEYVTGKKEI